MASPAWSAAPRPIVAGVADPTVSQAPLQWAAEQARAFGKPLLALTVLPQPPVEPWPTTGHPAQDDETRYRTILDEAIKRLGDAAHGIEVRRELRQGSVVRVLVHASNDADLLVLGGRRARGRFDQRPMSIASQCIQLAACPVVIVPVARPHRRKREETVET